MDTPWLYQPRCRSRGACAVPGKRPDCCVPVDLDLIPVQLSAQPKQKLLLSGDGMMMRRRVKGRCKDVSRADAINRIGIFPNPPASRTLFLLP